MTFWERLVELLDTQMNEPTLFGWFHLLFVALSIAAGVLLVRWCQDAPLCAPGDACHRRGNPI